MSQYLRDQGMERTARVTRYNNSNDGPPDA
jgi:hypothetical protein